MKMTKTNRMKGIAVSDGVYESPVPTLESEACPIPVSTRVFDTRVETGDLHIGNAKR